MRMLEAVYINEVYKISKKKKITVALIISLLSVIATAIIVYCLNNFAGIRLTGSSEFSIMVLSVLNYSIFPLFTAFISIDMFAGEFADNTIKFTLTGPASRLNVFLGKIIAIASFIMANLIFVMVLSLIASLLLNGSTPNLIQVILSYLLAFLPMFTFSLVVVLISIIAKGTTSSFMFSILVFLLFTGLGIVFPYFKSILFTSTLDWYKLILGIYINFSKILRIFLILLGYCIMLLTLGYYLFEKKDI